MAVTNVHKVYASGFLFNVSFLAFAVLVPLTALHDHLPLWLVGVLAAVPGALQLPTRILSGPLVDHLGERLVLWVTYGLAVLAGLVVVSGSSYPMASLVLGQLCIGSARGLFWTAAQSEVGREASGRARALGLFTSYTKGGALVGTALAGTLAEFLGLNGGFVFTVILAVLALVIGSTLTKSAVVDRPGTLGQAVARLIPAGRQPFVMVYGMVAFLCAIPQALAQSFYPVTLVRLGVSDSVASLITALMSCGMIIAGVFGARALARLGMRRLLAVAMVLVAGSLLLTADPEVVVDAVAIFLAGFGAGWLNVGFLTAVSGRSHDYDRATNLAVTQMYFVIAVIGTPLLSGGLFHVIGQNGSFAVESGLAFVVVAMVMGLWRWQARADDRSVSEYRPA